MLRSTSFGTETAEADEARELAQGLDRFLHDGIEPDCHSLS